MAPSRYLLWTYLIVSIGTYGAIAVDLDEIDLLLASVPTIIMGLLLGVSDGSRLVSSRFAVAASTSRCG